MEIIRHGKFKSAVEPFLAQEISKENREQVTVLLQSVWESIVSDIAKNRNISVMQLNAIASDLLARTPEMALQQKLIDKVAYEDEFTDAVKSKLKIAKSDDIATISISDYVATTTLNSEDYTKDDIIAVIYAQGDINGGEGDVDYIGEVSINRSLKEAREDDEVKAVVLRVDSPGGSALVSDLIWREIELTKKVKPVVVSMGNLAASGGYYIACNANTIFAEPTTITGSIGVFGMLPNAHGFATKYGVNAEQIQTHKNAIGYSIFEPI
jgi:protease-4